MKSGRSEHPRRYSCEEVYKRMDNGLCLFCEDLDTPGHYQSKHKRSKIFMVELEDDQLSYENELVNLASEIDPSLHQVVKPLKYFQVSQYLVGLNQKEVLAKTVSEEKLNLPLEQNIEQLVGDKNQNTLINPVPITTPYSSIVIDSSKFVELSLIKPSSDTELSLSKVYSRSSISVWEPGGLSAIMEPEKYHIHDNMMELPSKLHKMCTQQNTNGVGILDSFSELIDPEGVKVSEVAFHVYGASASGYVMISLPQWVLETGKADLSDCEGMSFKSINKEQALHGLPNIVLTQRVWEPGGVLNKHDKWKGLENQYNLSSLMRLMQRICSMWWQGIQSRELHRIAACSLVGVKMWLDICSFEYKIHMLLLRYHGLEVKMLSCLQELGIRSKTDNVLKFLVGMAVLFIYEVAETFEKLAKTWRFKFKASSKKRGLMEDKFSSVEESSGEAVVHMKAYLILLLKGPSHCFICYKMLRGSYVTQKQIIAEGLISLTRSQVCRFLLMCLQRYALQILCSSIHVLPRYKAVFQPSGKDITLLFVYHDGTVHVISGSDTVLQVTKKEPEFVVSDISEKHGPSLLKGFNVPVRVEFDLHGRLKPEMPLDTLAMNITWKEKHLEMRNAKEPAFIFDMKMSKRHKNVVTKVLTLWKVHPPDQTTWRLYQDSINKYPPLVAGYYLCRSGFHTLLWTYFIMAHGMHNAFDKEDRWKTAKQLLENGIRNLIGTTKVKHNLVNCQGRYLFGDSLGRKDSVPNMITGATQGDIMVLNSTTLRDKNRSTIHYLYEYEMQNQPIQAKVQRSIFKRATTKYCDQWKEHPPDQATWKFHQNIIEVSPFSESPRNNNMFSLHSRLCVEEWMKHIAFKSCEEVELVIKRDVVAQRDRDVMDKTLQKSLPFYFTYPPKERASVLVKTHELALVKKMTTRHNRAVSKVFGDWKLHPPDQAVKQFHHDFLNKYLLLILEDKDSQQGSSVTGLLVHGFNLVHYSMLV